MNRQQFADQTLKSGPPGVVDTEALVLGLCCWYWAEDSGGSNTSPGAGARNNPADMTLETPTAKPFNTFGPDGRFHVYNYATPAVGIGAFWTCVQNGLYNDILAVLKNPAASAVDLASCRSLSTWGTGHFVSIAEAAQADPAPYYAPLVAGSDAAPTAPPRPLSVQGAGPLYLVTMATGTAGEGQALVPLPWERFRAATGQGSDPAVDGTTWGTNAHAQERTGEILLTVTCAPASSAATVLLLVT